MTHQVSSCETVYNPNRLLDVLLEKFGLKNDAELSRTFDISPPVLSKMRHGVLPVGAGTIIRIHEVSGMSIEELQRLMGNRRSKHRYSRPRKFI